MRMTGNWTRKGRAVAALSLAALAAATAGSGASAQSIAFIEQVGDNNQTGIDQSGSAGSTASAQFKGSANLLEVTQGGRDNRAVVSVTGSRNGRGDVVGGTGRTMAFAARTLNVYGVSNGNSSNNGNNGQGNPCGGGNGNGTGNPCNGNNGNSNGNGNAGSNSAPLTSTLTPLAGLESGVIRQQGQRNLAGVLIAGDSNDFHVTQLGNDNKAAQAVSGSFNQSAIVQGTPGGATANGNAAVQAQLGTGNSAYTHQAGNNNVAVAAQAGSTGITAGLANAALNSAGLLVAATANANYVQSAEAVIAGYGARGSGSGNSITLQQNGDNNTAVLGQFGNDNSIALRQPGNAYAAVTQLGDGHAIGIDQRAGTNGVSAISVTQY